MTITRREMLARAAQALLGARLATFSPRPRAFEDDVLIVRFSDAGEEQGRERVPKVVKTPGEWRKQLSALAFEITREGGTERPFSGAYWNLHEDGLFRCICCDTALFSSHAKFDSGTGWPSFWQPIAGRT